MKQVVKSNTKLRNLDLLHSRIAEGSRSRLSHLLSGYATKREGEKMMREG